VKLTAIALDYDGTIAHGDRLDESVREAIARLRSSGVVVILVTGRILRELRRVAGDLHFVDAVVAENGAVAHFPVSGYTSVLAPLIPGALLTELGRRGIPFVSGQCLVDTAADEGARILEVIRTLELPLVQMFNRSRLMVLPQGVSKATGLHTVLEMLRLSARNTLAIGDAENDHEMLRIAEIGAAVAWGSAALRAAADLVVEGTGPAAVAGLLGPLAITRLLPPPARVRRRLVLGHTEDGHEFSLAVRGRNVLVAGDAKSGKSWVAGLLCEQLILQGYCVCVIDPEGDYRSLEALPGVSLLGGEDAPPTPKQLLRALRYPDRSVVIDLSHLPQDQKIEYIRAVLPALNVMRRRTGLPHRIVLDEAHYFLHDAKARHLLDLERNGYTVVTYCASRLPAELLAATEVMIVTCESDPAEVAALCRCCAGCAHVDSDRWRVQLGHVALGQAVALPITEEAAGEVRRFTISRRLTPHVRHREKYVDVPVTEARAFVFSDGPQPWSRARTLRQFVADVERPGAGIDGYLKRGDFSRWIADVFGDHALAAELREQEDRYRRGGDGEAASEISAAVRGRYDLTENGLDLPYVESDSWRELRVLGHSKVA
jgi:hydroxymethylpyrimidine pyrophosphatase-like HAD family hydrolase